MKNSPKKPEPLTGAWQKRGMTDNFSKSMLYSCSDRQITIKLFQVISSAQLYWADLPGRHSNEYPAFAKPGSLAVIPHFPERK
jgi:hypothetical protein